MADGARGSVAPEPMCQAASRSRFSPSISLFVGQGALSPDLTVPIDTTLSQEDLDGLLVVVSAEIWTAESGIVAGEQLLTLSVLGR
jgi:hypothetical protein